jgi:hypothetical protein
VHFAIGVACLWAARTVSADTIVQNGIVSGVGDPQTQTVLINRFDTQGGTRQLNFIQLDFLTSVIGGYQTDGSGTPVHIFAQLDAEWSLGPQLLADTQALIDSIVANTNRGSATVFNSDPQQLILDQPGDLAPWIGSGQLGLSVFTQFQVSEDPADIIFFGAGGSVRYTVTYDYSIVPSPGAAAMLLIPLIGSRRRRSSAPSR